MFSLRSSVPHITKPLRPWCGSFCPDLKSFCLFGLSNRYTEKRHEMFQRLQAIFLSPFSRSDFCLMENHFFLFLFTGCLHVRWSVRCFRRMHRLYVAAWGIQTAVAEAKRHQSSGSQWQASVMIIPLNYWYLSFFLFSSCWEISRLNAFVLQLTIMLTIR